MNAPAPIPDTILADATKRLRLELDAARSALAEGEADESAHAKLIEEVARLESRINPRDFRAVQTLSAKREQVRLWERRVAETDARLAPFVTRLRDALEPIPDALRAALTPRRAALVERIADALAPFTNDASRRSLACQTDSLRSLDSLLRCAWQMDAVQAPVPTAERVLTQLDEILQGAEPWLPARPDRPD